MNKHALLFALLGLAVACDGKDPEGDTSAADTDPTVDESDDTGAAPTDDTEGTSTADDTDGTDSTPTDDTGEPPTAPEACGNPVSFDDGGHWLQEDLFGATELVDLPNEQGPGVILGDFDGDGWLDAVMTVGVERSLAFKNDGTGQLQPTDAFTVDGGDFPSANSLASADLDGDGDLDIVLSRMRGVDDLVLLNDGAGAFTSTALPDSQGESVTPTVADLDSDGDLDLFMGGFVPWLDPREVMDGEQVGDGLKLYYQDSGAFVDATDRLPSEVLDALTFHGAVLDYDADGDLDIYLGNDYSRYVVQSDLLINNGGTFEPADCLCDLPGTIMGVTPGDANGDSLVDLYITDWAKDFLFINRGDGSFYEGGLAMGAEPDNEDSMVGWASAFVDIDGDSDLDLASMYGPVIVGPADVPAEQPDALLLFEDGSYTDVSDAVGFNDDGIGRSIAVGDLDRDGKPDLVISGRVYLRSFLTRGGCDAGITLNLDDGAMNRQGFGARVDAEVGGATLTRWMLPSTTFGASAAEIHLGLGGLTQAERVVVTWTDGRESVLTDVAAGTRAIVTPPDSD